MTTPTVHQALAHAEGIVRLADRLAESGERVPGGALAAVQLRLDAEALVRRLHTVIDLASKGAA